MSDYRRIVKGRPQTVRLRSGNDDFLDGNLSQNSYDQSPIGKLVTISKAKLHVSGEMIHDIGVGHLSRGADTPKRTSCRWTRRLADTSAHECWRCAAHVIAFHQSQSGCLPVSQNGPTASLSHERLFIGARLVASMYRIDPLMLVPGCN